MRVHASITCLVVCTCVSVCMWRSALCYILHAQSRPGSCIKLYTYFTMSLNAIGWSVSCISHGWTWYYGDQLMLELRWVDGVHVCVGVCFSSVHVHVATFPNAGWHAWEQKILVTSRTLHTSCYRAFCVAMKKSGDGIVVKSPDFLLWNVCLSVCSWQTVGWR